MSSACATNKLEVRKDGTICATTINLLLDHRSIRYDKTKLRLGSDKDTSGSWLKIHSNPSLNHSGACHTRRCGHVTGRITVIGRVKLLPLLLIFNSNAEREEDLAIQDK